MFKQYLLNFDYQIFSFLNDFAGKFFTADAIFIFLAEAVIVLMVMLLAAFILAEKAGAKKKSSRNVTIIEALVSAFAAKLIFVSLIRMWFFRPRPFLQGTVTQLIAHNPLEGAFPSGHAAFMFALASSIFFRNKKWGAFFLALAVLSSVSRIIVGVHFPLDIIGGALVGLLSSLIVKLVSDFCVMKKKSSK